MFVDHTAFNVTPHEAVSVNIDDKIFELLGIVAPSPDGSQEVWDHVPADQRGSVSFVWTRYGFFFLRAAGLVPGTFLLCTAHLDKCQVVAARTLPPPLHVRLVESGAEETVVVLFGQLEKTAMGIPSGEVANELLGAVDPNGLAAAVHATSFAGEFRLTGQGLRLLRVQNTGDLTVLPPRLSVFPQVDNSLDYAALNTAADATLHAAGIPPPLSIDACVGLPFWTDDYQ
ncbi:hypothetical protein M3Y99_00624400 [Aphelenchoides fujianensis]|nr:hypothetical protein M3Y99_00624400 [Aphelenchoides fujianensis]